ncbi:MAG: hypothetical protein WD830_03880 [Chloroflexota bacterium]
MTGGWRLVLRPSTSLPPMAWVLRARPPVAELTFGQSVRPSDAGVFEGTWVGDAGELGPLRSATTFGSGVLLDGEDGEALHIIPPGHMLEGVYLRRRREELIAANSLVGLIAAAGLDLDPNVSYPPLFNESVDGVMHTTIPTTTDPIEAHFHDNMRLDLDGRLTAVSKPREKPFANFADYRRRLYDALASALPTRRRSSRPSPSHRVTTAPQLRCSHLNSAADGL